MAPRRQKSQDTFVLPRCWGRGDKETKSRKIKRKNLTVGTPGFRGGDPDRRGTTNLIQRRPAWAG